MSRKHIKSATFQSQENESTSSETTEIKLSEDCLIHIFKYLTISERIKVERVCRTWLRASWAAWETFHYIDYTKELWGDVKGQKVTALSMYRVLRRCGQYIEHLKATRDYSFNAQFNLEPSAALKPLKMCPNLTIVDLSKIYVSLPNLKTMMKHCKTVTELTIGRTSSSLNDDFLSTLFQAYAGLKVFRFLHHNGITGKCIMYLPEMIEELCLEHCYKLNFYHFVKDIKRLQNLKKLSVRGSISIEYANIKLDFLKEINLRELDISENQETIDNSSIVRIANACRNLTHLNIEGNSNITNEGLMKITMLPKLENLNISRISSVTDEGLKDMPCLKILNCRETGISVFALIKLLQTSKNLRKIDCSGCKNISNDSIKAVLEVAKKLNMFDKKTCLKFQSSEIY